MLTLASVWLPILLSTVVIFIASSVVWMLMPWHREDWRGLPNEEGARQALKGVPRGQYNLPHCASRQSMKDPEFQRKMQEGPIAFVTVMPSGMPAMGKQMVTWFLVVALLVIVVAYIATRTLAPGSDYLSVFRIVGTAAWLAFGAATLQEAVWFGRPWRTVATLQLDALIYALLAAGLFGSMWPAT